MRKYFFINKVKTSLILFLFVGALLNNSCEKDVTILSSEIPIYNGFIFIESNPRGAAIYQNGKNTGRITPDSLRYLPAGNYVINLKKKYFRDTSFSVSLSDPELKQIFIDYFSNPLMLGSINFTSDPTGAKIFINDSSTQTVTPLTSKNIKPGNYVIKYQKENFRDGIFNVVVESNKTAAAYYKLRDTSLWVDYQLSNSSIPSNLLTCISVDHNNVKWIGSFDKGLIKFNGTDFESYSTLNSPIPSKNVTCVEVDQNNKKWIGTDAGIAVFDNSTWNVYTKSNSGLASNIINSIKFENNIAWIGTPLGLVEFDGNSWLLHDTVITNPIPTYAAVNDIVVDFMGNKWLATSQTGIFKFTNGIYYSNYLNTIPGIPTNSLSRTAITSQGELWFGHLPYDGKRGGVSFFNGATWQTILIGSETNIVEDIFIDLTNTKWISTNEGLLQVFNHIPQSFFNRNNSLISANHIKALTVDWDGLIWVATYGGGLNKLKL